MHADRDEYQFSNAREWPQVKQLTVVAVAAAVPAAVLPLLLSCPIVAAIHSTFAAAATPAAAVAAPLPQSSGCASGSVLNCNTVVAPDPAHRCVNACFMRSARQRRPFVIKIN